MKLGQNGSLPLPFCEEPLPFSDLPPFPLPFPLPLPFNFPLAGRSSPLPFPFFVPLRLFGETPVDTGRSRFLAAELQP